MPRPATKRNRLTTKALGTSKQNQRQDSSRNNIGSRDIPQSPKSDAVGDSRLTATTDPAEIVRQLRNQTPISKAQELAIGSSPGTENGATGSRPPTRARGYSSTLSIAGRKGDTSSRIPGTPAFESSILSNFRRRPRQGSILHMMQDEDGSSDLDDDDFLGGLSPEDESTPLNISRKSLAIRHAMSSFPVETPLPSSGKSWKRKRSVEELEAPRSPLTASGTPGSPASESEVRGRSVSEELLPPPESSVAPSETMAPPISSPPSLTHVMSTPDSNQSPSRRRAPENHAAPQPADGKIHISTAALQDKLLPRRRQRRRARHDASGFEVLSDSDEDDFPPAAQDDDELSYLPSRKPSRSGRKQSSKSKPLRGNRTQQQAGKKDSKSDGNEPKCVKKYESGTREETSVDKENGLVDMSSPLSSALDTDAFDSDFLLEQEEVPNKEYLSEELRLQALKFAEVDKWQMEFEDVVVSGTQ